METTFTEKEVKEMMAKSFIDGKNWGETYSGWYSPTVEDHANKLISCCDEIYNRAMINRNENQIESDEVIKLKKQLISLSHKAMELEEIFYRLIKYLPEPQKTDNESWWCGRTRIRDFASFQEAHKLWNSKQ